MSFERLRYILKRAPRILAILKELWLILSNTEQENVDQFLKEMEGAAHDLRTSNTLDDSIDAAHRLSRLISRL